MSEKLLNLDQLPAVEELLERCKPVLAGYPPAVQGATLAYLTAILVTGHLIPGDPKGTVELWNEIMATQYRCVEELVAVKAAMLGISDVPKSKPAKDHK